MVEQCEGIMGGIEADFPTGEMGKIKMMNGGGLGRCECEENGA